MEENKMDKDNMDLANNESFKLGMAAGRQQLMDHIQYQFEIGKPCTINGKLYWLRDARQNLQDIMDDIETAWNDENGLNKFIVPIKRSYTNDEVTREVIIQTDKAETAMLIATGDFQHNGWIVDTDYENYKRFKG